MSDFAESILREKPDLPVVRGDMPDTWIHGIGSMPIETQLAHTTRPRIAALESLDTLLGSGVFRDVPPPLRFVTPTRTRSCSANTPGGPTWADMPATPTAKPGEETRRRRLPLLLEGFDQKRAYAHKAAELVEPALAERMTALARAVNVDGRRVVVFNPLPWKRDDVVELSWADDTRALTDVASGEVLPAAFDGGRLRFVAKNLPPMGYRTFSASRKQASGLVRADAKMQILQTSCSA